MRLLRWTLIATACVLVAGCNKKPTAAETAAPTVAATPTPAAAATEVSAEDRVAADKTARLAYATMEDSYINDTKAQWAASGKASSSFNDNPEAVKADPKESRAWRATGSPDNSTWTQAKQDVGMDWLELGYAKSVNATEVRVVMTRHEAPESITKVELIDEAGAAQTVWSGVSDVKPDQRGDRTWFVRPFSKTATKIKAVKLTFANNVSPGYKEVDAVQLVGE